VRTIRVLSVVAAALAWGAQADPARADCASESHLSTCFDADNFWPHAGPAYFNFVGGTATTARGTVGFGLVTTYLTRPVVLSIPSSDPQGADVIAVRDLVDTTPLFSLGLTDRLDVDLAVPVALYRTGIGISPLTSQGSESIPRTAMRDLRAGATFRFMGASPRMTDDARFGLAGRFELSLPTGAQGSFAGDGSVVAIPSLAAEWRPGALVLGAEVGGRVRKTADLAGSRVGSQLVLALGAGVDVLDLSRLGVFAEVAALPTFAAQRDLVRDPITGDRSDAGGRAPLVPIEWQLGIRSADILAQGVSLSLGAGSALFIGGESAVTSPRFRATLSIRYAPRWTADGGS
jgi:OOP family OmpA-OmpF porin